MKKITVLLAAIFLLFVFVSCDTEHGGTGETGVATITVVTDENTQNDETAETPATIIESDSFVISVKNNEATVISWMSDTYDQDDIVVPDTLEGYPVVAIGERAFRKGFEVNKITLPASVKSIAEDAFWGCYDLVRIDVDVNNQYYSNDENGVLFNKDKTALIMIPEEIEEYTIPATVEYIADYAIDKTRYRDWRNINISPENTNFIVEDGVWYNIDKTELIIAKSFGHGSPPGNLLLDTLTIPASVKSIKKTAFFSATNLKNIIVEEGNQYFVIDENGVLFNKDKTELIVAPRDIESYVIPNSVTTIKNSAFARCSILSSIEIPDSVTSIEENAFREIYYRNKGKDFKIPDSVTNIGHAAFYGSGLICKELVLPESVQTIEAEAFGECAVESVVIPNSVTSIEAMTFSGCSNLKKVVIPDSITSIGDMAFWHCQALVDIDIPNSVTYIGYFAFADCSELCSINISESITKIRASTFRGCTRLNDIYIPSSVQIIDNYAFYDCFSFGGNIVLPEGLKSIGIRAFERCFVENIAIPESVEMIAESAFSGCSLKAVTIPAGVKSIGRNAFSGCNKLIVAEDNNNYSSDVQGALYNKDKTELLWVPADLEIFTIPNSVVTIGEEAFCGSNVETVLVPSNVKTIKNRAFVGSHDISSIKLSEGIETIGAGAFMNCYNLESVEIPKSVKRIGDFYNKVSGDKTMAQIGYLDEFGNEIVEKFFTVKCYAGSVADEWAKQYADILDIEYID